jgi:hypothetical protein
MSKHHKPLPSRPLLARAVEGAAEPLVLSSPPLGRSGIVKVRKPLRDALEADPTSIGAHVAGLHARIEQGTTGERVVSLRIDLDEDFPNQPLAKLSERLQPLIDAGHARCAAVLGAEFRVLSVSFGGKKLR